MKYVIITVGLIVILVAFLGLNLGLDWVADNYGEFYKWMTLGSGVCMFGGFIADAFIVLAGWHVGLFLILSFPMLHRAIWLEQKQLHEKAGAYDKEMNTS